MTGFVLALLGAMAGTGLFLIVRSLVTDRTIALSEVRLGEAVEGQSVARAATRSTPSTSDDGATRGITAVMGRMGVRLTDTVGMVDPERLRSQLRVLDQSVERHGYEKLLAAVAGFVFPILFAFALSLGGIRLPVLGVLVAAVGLMVGGFFYPDLTLAERADERRRAFRHALGSYLDLVTILISGGAGIESALEGAAEDGAGWPFVEIRNALRRADLTRTSPWVAFDELGAELAVPELRALAASVSLAGSQGARIKLSLAAKADALRAAQAAEIEAASERQTEKMIVPLVAMALGITLFVGYAAVSVIGTEPELPTDTDVPATPIGNG